MKVSTLDIVSALTVIAQAGLTIQQIEALLKKENLTDADVITQLDNTDVAIMAALADN